MQQFNFTVFGERLYLDKGYNESIFQFNFAGN